MTERERIAERIKRLKILADLGKNKEERDTAQRLFEKLIRQYDFVAADFEDDSEEIDRFEFRFKGSEEEKILLQVCAKVLNSLTISTYSRYKNNRKIPGLLYIECSKKQNAEISFLYDFYKELWKKEKEIILSAFIQKHGIAPDPGENGGKEISAEDLRDLLRRMSCLSDADPILRLETA